MGDRIKHDPAVPAAIADLIAAAREAAVFLAGGAGGANGERLAEDLRTGLSQATPLLKRIDDADAVPAFVDTLNAVLAVARPILAEGLLTEAERVAVAGAIKAGEELLAEWLAPPSSAAPATSAEIVQLRRQGDKLVPIPLK